jgi:hypothetical protein
MLYIDFEERHGVEYEDIWRRLMLFGPKETPSLEQRNKRDGAFPSFPLPKYFEEDQQLYRVCPDFPFLSTFFYGGSFLSRIEASCRCMMGSSR